MEGLGLDFRVTGGGFRVTLRYFRFLFLFIFYFYFFIKKTKAFVTGLNLVFSTFLLIKYFIEKSMFENIQIQNYSIIIFNQLFDISSAMIEIV